LTRGWPRWATGGGCGLLAYLAGSALLPHGVPLGVVVLGVAFGLVNALGAVGIVLVHRAGGYLNLAQAAVGSVAATLAFRLVVIRDWNWYTAVVVGLLAAAALSVLCELLFLQRLFAAPRLVVTVATIGIAQVCASVGIALTNVVSTRGQIVFDVPSPPFDLVLTLGPVRFDSAFLLVFAVAPPLLALVVLGARSRYGSVLRASAENPDRARLLGISVRTVSTGVWLVAGLLGGVAALLSTPITNVGLGSGMAPSVLLLALAPAMIAGLDDLGVAVAAAISLGVLEQALAFSYPRSSPGEIAIVLAVAVALVVRRDRLGRGALRGRDDLTPHLAAPAPAQPALRRWRVAGQALLVSVAVAIPLLLSVSQQDRATLVLISILAALSLTILTGFAGQVSFGQWAMVGFGALLGGHLATVEGIGFLPGLVLIPAIGMIVAALVGLPALHLRGSLQGVTTLAFAVIASAVVFDHELFRMTGPVHPPELIGVDLSNRRTYYYATLLVLGGVLVAVGWLRRTSLGRAMVATRDDSRVAEAFGMRVAPTKLAAFAIAGGIAALAGYLYLYSARTLTPGSFTPVVSLTLFAAFVIGGTATRAGAVIAGLVAETTAAVLPDALQFLTTGLGLLLVLMLLPQGVGPGLIDLRNLVMRRLVPSAVPRRQ